MDLFDKLSFSVNKDDGNGRTDERDDDNPLAQEAKG